ncbi:nuclear protein 2-like [Choloepus didactylus]|uniref:nuclear protein 2-like n=1 Tax=Choloepus didactylus TaxID=27675 RepID=UPI0018A03BEC|nr:nuclear protein 2-like [Choloepus didactylus]
MEAGAHPALSRSRGWALPLLGETRPRVSTEEELYDCVDYYYLRDFPACRAGCSKGQTRRKWELRTNRPVPGGHEYKIAQKLLNGQRKHHQCQLQPRPRTRLT